MCIQSFDLSVSCLSDEQGPTLYYCLVYQFVMVYDDIFQWKLYFVSGHPESLPLLCGENGGTAVILLHAEQGSESISLVCRKTSLFILRIIMLVLSQHKF
jgi:hypothetical protein